MELRASIFNSPTLMAGLSKNRTVAVSANVFVAANPLDRLANIPVELTSADTRPLVVAEIDSRPVVEMFPLTSAVALDDDSTDSIG